MTQLSIDDITFFKHGGNEYSREANKSLKGDKSRLRMEVFNIIKRSPTGLTTDEVQSKTGYLHQTVSARMSELKAVDWIEATGEKRITRSGRNAGVWKVKDHE